VENFNYYETFAGYVFLKRLKIGKGERNEKMPIL